jgi:excisionase family DNA binding protein
MCVGNTENNHSDYEAFLTPAELARRWRWHPESIRRWTRLGKLPIVKIGRRTLIPLSAIEALEADGQIDVKNG